MLNNIRNWKFVLSVFALAPFLHTLFLFAFYLHSTIELGYFPKYDNPDPKQMQFYDVYEPIIIASGNIWLMSIILWIPLVLIYWIKFKNKTNWKPVIFALFSFLLAIISIFTSITEWFAD
jgi:hypothetical protein